MCPRAMPPNRDSALRGLDRRLIVSSTFFDGAAFGPAQRRDRRHISILAFDVTRLMTCRSCAVDPKLWDSSSGVGPLLGAGGRAPVFGAATGDRVVQSALHLSVTTYTQDTYSWNRFERGLICFYAVSIFRRWDELAESCGLFL